MAEAERKVLYDIDGESFRRDIEKLGLTPTILSRMCGYKDAYIGNNLYMNKIPMEVIEYIKRVYDADLSRHLRKTVKSEPAKPAIAGADYEPIISAIGQATAILSNQLSEVIKQLKMLNENRIEELNARQKNLTDAMVSAIILGLQESKTIIGDGVKTGVNNSSELRNVITQAIRNARTK